MIVVDWDALRVAARRAAASAYAPYSGLHVGVAGLSSNGTVFTACNVENVSFGLTLCAECGLVSALRSAGEDSLIAVAAADDRGNLLTPCGRCRQLLMEHGGSSMLVDTDPIPLPLAELLPGAFDASDLPSSGGRP